MFDAMEELLANESFDFLLGKNCSKECEFSTDCFKELFSFKKSEFVVIH
jgi:hypothetical protein